MEAVHEGYAAQLRRRREFYAETGRRGKGEKLGTYRVAAMRQLQDDFHAEVSGKFGLMRTGPCRPRTSYTEAQQRKRQQQEDADQLALAQWHAERQVRRHKDRMALLALQMQDAQADDTEGQLALIDHQQALWQLAQDAINTVWKIGSASEMASVQEIAHALVERFNTLVQDKQKASPRLRRK